MTYGRVCILLGWVGLAACDDNSGLQATTGEEGESGSTSTGGGDEGDGSGGDAPGDEFSCASARWTIVERASDGISAVEVDSRGHARFMAPIAPLDYRVLDVDAVGGIAVDLRLSTEHAFIRFAGLDGADNLFLDIEDRDGDDPRHRLRKYDVAGEQLWETDLGPSPNTNLLGTPKILADGSAVTGVQIVSEAKLTLRKYDPAGGLQWEIADDSFLSLAAVNADGLILAIEAFGPRVRVRTADGETLWEKSWAPEGIAAGYIDAGGNVVVLSATDELARFGADGQLLWERSSDDLPIPLGHLTDLAINAAGDIAVLGWQRDGGGDIAFTLDPAGELIGQVVCERLSMERVAIDDAGALYVGGFHLRNGAYDAVMTAF